LFSPVERHERNQSAAVVFDAVIAVTVAERATADDDRNACIHQSGDVAIAACTRLIKSGKYSGRTLAAYYANRGFELKDKADYDHALEDFSQAIRIDPESSNTVRR
jgi:tetratricopeptide (TPR) repeat protein